MKRREIYRTLLASGTAGVLFPGAEMTMAAVVARASADSRNQAIADIRQFGAVGDGTTDDTDAIAAAFASASQSGLAVVFPCGFAFRITRYVQILSNTTLYILGTLRLSNRSSGLYANGASNIGIFGGRIGRVEDSQVAADYRWNDFNSPLAPAIHLRSTRNVLIDGLNISRCQQGILISNATANSSLIGKLALAQPNPAGCVVNNCNIQFCEMGGICGFNAEDSRYVGNYVYRCGDGGIWMMGARDCEVIGNHRVSPYASAADVARYGRNDARHPATWNDEQGLEFENCHGLLIANNVVRGMWGAGIDVKNGCNRVRVNSNNVLDCENSSIIVREGDAVKNACHKISICGNTISGHGTLHYAEATSGRGAIRVGECFISEVTDNVIHGYRTTEGIVCVGPGQYQGRWYPKNPHQGSLVVAGNLFDFKNSAFELESEIQFDTRTLGAIVIEGQYDSVKCCDNKVSTDRYLPTDVRLNEAPAISLRYVRANDTCYPLNAMVNNNSISNWGNWGIVVKGLPEAQCSGLLVSGNAIGAIAGGGGIHLSHTNAVVCGGNTINQVLAGSVAPGIWLQGSNENPLSGATVSGNQVSGGWEAGSNGLGFGVRLDYCGDCNVSNNTVRAASQGSVGVFNVRGNIIFNGTTGFPRSGSASPNGALVSYHPGEMYQNIATSDWWIAASGASIVWTKI